MSSLAAIKIASALEKIADEGIRIQIIFPADTDKFVTDLPVMKIAEALVDVGGAILSAADLVKNGGVLSD